jgi:hypothetical protein
MRPFQKVNKQALFRCLILGYTIIKKTSIQTSDDLYFVKLISGMGWYGWVV